MDEYIRKQDVLNLPQSTERNFRGEIVERSIDVKDIEALEPADVAPVNREKLMAVLRDYFSIGDSYTYELTRVKSAFDIGTMSLDDFKEWEEEDISCLCDYILRELRRGNISAERGDNNVAES